MHVEQPGNFEVDEFALFPANALRDGVCESFQVARGSMPFGLEVVSVFPIHMIEARLKGNRFVEEGSSLALVCDLGQPCSSATTIIAKYQ